MSPIRTARPYAAKAIIEHDFDTDHLNVYITFRFPMDQNLKPANAKWLCVVDSVSKTTSASIWLDFFTLLLTVDAVALIPDVVTLEYNGPSSNLVTTWNKQWEPWGPILSTGRTGPPYGSFWGNEIAWTQIAAAGVWYTVSDPDITLGIQRKMTFQNNQEFKIQKAAAYHVYYQVSAEISIAGKHMETAPAINGTVQDDGRASRLVANRNEEGSWSGGAEFILAVDDLVSVQIRTVDAGNPTITVNHIGLTLFSIDGN